MTNTNNNNTNNSNLTGIAIALAAKVHEKQVDNGGNAYILHPMRVMQRLRTTDCELMQMAIMHDVVEDSDGEVTFETLYNLGFSKRVLDALELLTHNKDESYDSYIMKIASNIDAIRVKMEDLRDNSDITRLKGLREKDFERMKKYNKAYVYLKGVLENMQSVGYNR